MVCFVYNRYCSIGGEPATLDWASDTGASVTFDKYGKIDFGSDGKGSNAQVEVQLQQEYGRYFCSTATCGGFSSWISSLAIFREKVGVLFKILDKATDLPIENARVEIGGEHCITGMEGVCGLILWAQTSYDVKVTHPDYHDYSEKISVGAEKISPTMWLTKKTAPPPPPPPEPEPEPEPTPSECKELKWYDVPGALRCIWHSLMRLPTTMWAGILNVMGFAAGKAFAVPLAQIEARLDQTNPGWREEMQKMGYTKSPLAPGAIFGAMTVIAFIFGFVGGPVFEQGRQWAFSTMPNRIPSGSDLVRMELREVFRPEERAEQMQPPPSVDFYDYMKPLGFSKFWADSYWAAHWELPSVTQGYEMYHRLRPGKTGISAPFTRTDLKKLLVRQDVLLRYQDQLIDIAYLPLTRVDVRRMYSFGVLNRKEVKEAYLDIGYNETSAELLTRFTEAYEAPEDKRSRELSLSDMEKLLALGNIQEADFYRWLEKMGYSSQARDWELILAKAEREKAPAAKREKELSLTDWEKLLYEGKLTWSEIKKRMTELGYSERARKDENLILKIDALKKWEAAAMAYLIEIEEVLKRMKDLEFTAAEIAAEKKKLEAAL